MQTRQLKLFNPMEFKATLTFAVFVDWPLILIRKHHTLLFSVVLIISNFFFAGWILSPIHMFRSLSFFDNQFQSRNYVAVLRIPCFWMPTGAANCKCESISGPVLLDPRGWVHSSGYGNGNRIATRRSASHHHVRLRTRLQPGEPLISQPQSWP